MKIVEENGVAIRLPITCENVKNQIAEFEVNHRKWDDDDIEKLPRLLALIFAMWTLMNAENN